MSIPQAVRIARVYRRRKQDEITGYSQQMVSAIESGKRPVAKDAAPLLANQLDHPAVYAELARELTGVGITWLDGTNVDLHRSAVREKALEELREAMAELEKFAAHKPPHAETERDRKDRYGHLLQAWDAMVALYTYVGTQCLEYEFSMRQLSNDHHNKLRGKRYVTA